MRDPVEGRDPQELKPGFTWRSALAILLTVLVFTPISIYVQLVAGIGSLPAVAILMALIFSEVTRATGNPLTKQELFIIYQMSALAAGATTCYLYQVQKSYFMTSPLARSFRLNGTPLPQLIPSWWAPPPMSEAYVLRTFLHSDWLLPLLVVNVQGGLFFYFVELSLTVLMAHLYIETEKLPFPLAAIDAALVSTLSERDPDRMRLFVYSIYPGVVWGAILYLIPSLTGIRLVPLPWIDLTTFVAKWLPGALLGLATDLLPYLSGFFIPLNVASCMLASSLVIWVMGTPLTLTVFRDAFPEWVSEYFQGMSLEQVYARSLLRVWIVPQIAFAYASIAVFLALGGGTIVNAFRSFARLRAASGYPTFWKIIVIYLIGSIGSVILFSLLVPEFPLLLAFFASTVLSLLNAMITTRSIGETGYSISIPYEWNTIVYLSGYKGVRAWIFSPVIGGLPSLEGGSPYWVYMIKVGYLTNTRPSDVLKALIYSIILYNIFSFVWTEFFWRLAPIPSNAYPYALAAWPAALVGGAVWITGGISVKPWLFYYSFTGMLGILLAGEFLAKSFHIPFSSMGIVTGSMTIPPYTIPIFTGSCLSNFVLRKFIRDWDRRKSIIVAGVSTGQGVILGIGVAMMLISKATWIKPW